MDLLAVFSLVVLTVSSAHSHADTQLQEPDVQSGQGISVYLMRQVFKLEGTVEEIKTTQLKRIEEDIDELKSNANNDNEPQEFEELRQENEAMKAEIEDLSQEIENIKKKTSELQESNSELQERSTALQESNSELQKEVSKLLISNEAVSNSKGQMCDEMEQRFGIVETRLSQAKSEMERLDKLESELKMCRGLVDSLKIETKETKENCDNESAQVRALLEQKMLSMSTKIDRQETCQSGLNVGVHAYPQHSFPYTVTVKFNPPFKNAPAFVYGTTLLDTISSIHYNARLTEVTNELFTLSMITWSSYSLYGARISWMACPK